jgi:signal transduction histidine kinase
MKCDGLDVEQLARRSVPPSTMSLLGLLRHLAEVECDCDHRLPATVELAMYRVALEAINNVVRHAHAAHAEVSLRLVDGTVELIVSDDGVGISQPYVSGLGITSMRSRIEALGGLFDMSQPPVAEAD